MLTNLKLTLTADRKLVSVECDDFRVKINGLQNDVYRKLFKEIGIELVFNGDMIKSDVSADMLRVVKANIGLE